MAGSEIGPRGHGDDDIPILLTVILGIQHALCMIGSSDSPPLAIAAGASYLDSTTTQYTVYAAFIVTDSALRPYCK
ncbi:Uu.00g088410.m01.CDS01 [Anthostomella pinea]|uniref:Uu.00g088410.m01.CDS01 n=1 Tax=Anthostomella pinea TaxID=933095 RepID=A0AAI8VMI7_9PEZI|nr:Uu.00g088410.m01.CDS01 [Anthostomella pinea]